MTGPGPDDAADRPTTDEGPATDAATDGDAGADATALAALRAIALRLEVARRLDPPAGLAVLRSIVEATAALFDAEAASIALHDPVEDRLVFRVAAGEHGQGVVGLAIDPGQGVAGYVFQTGQAIALADVASDARFGRATAEQTGYVPRSLVAVPLLDDEGSIGVLEVLDKRTGAFDLHDVELAGVFARQATIAIRASRLERDAASLIRTVLAAAAGDELTEAAETIARAAVTGLDADDGLWGLVEEIARVRTADPDQVGLLRELVAVLARRAEREADARRRHRGR